MKPMSIYLKLLLIVTVQLSFGISANAASESDAGNDAFEKRAFYTITTEVGGKALALTFIVPPGGGSLTNQAKKAKVILDTTKAKEKSQLWQIKHEQIHPGNFFSIWPKISDHGGDKLSGVLRVYKVNGEFSGADDDKYHEENNRLSVAGNVGETQQYWQILKQANGKYQITNAHGTKENLKRKEDAAEYGWREIRVLEAVKSADGKIVLRHNIPSKAPGQLWTITKAGY